MSRLKVDKAPWGPGTEYATYADYWEAEVLAPLRKAYKELTGKEAFPNGEAIHSCEE